jgi:hypothetical protein
MPVTVISRILVAFVLIAIWSATFSSTAAQDAQALQPTVEGPACAETIPAGFVSEFAAVNGTTTVRR